MVTRRLLLDLAAPLCLTVATLSATGCERKEKVFELKTSEGEIEVKRSDQSGNLSIDISEQ